MIRAGTSLGPALALSLGIAAASPVFGQSLNLASDADGGPIEIFADDGIEWQRENEVLIARGNARAVRKDIAVRADVLRAHYARGSDGTTELSRLEAAGGVKIASPSENITGDSAVYNLEKAILVVAGERVRLDTGNDQITANQQMEYWERKQMAVARGRAVGLHDGKRIRAEVLVAFLRSDRQGKSRVFRVEAFDDVVIQTEIDTVRANEGVYNVDSGIATLTGNVRITRGENQLAGDNAEIDLNTGISKMLGPVRGLLVPKK